LDLGVNAIIDPDIHPMAGLSSLDSHHWTGVTTPELDRLGPGVFRYRTLDCRERTRCSVSITGGILGILLGAAFLIAAFLHWKCGDQIQGGFRVEEVPAAEIVSEMRQAAYAICNF
jgi:hypothetical protein